MGNMTVLPAHVGRQTDNETGCALICTATPGGNPHGDPLCGKPATYHVKWNADGENGLACDEHFDVALNFSPVGVHGTENGACGMPGAIWVDGPPSHCTMLALDEEPARELYAAVTL